MIPREVIYSDVLRAIDFVSLNGYPASRKSKKYDLIYEGEPFPPKYLISVASEFSTYGRFLFHQEFNAVEAKKCLEKFGFIISLKDKFRLIQVIDDLKPKNRKNTIDELKKVIRKLSELPLERIKFLVEISNRRDTPLIKLLKQLYNHQCQMPECTASIKKRNGEYYCEVAHITPYSKIRSSTVDNLVVLCPNHHKEFDLGELEIFYRELDIVEGILNGKHFQFQLKC